MRQNPQNQWASVRVTIVDEIDLADVKAIGCYRFGKSHNPKAVTLIVIVDIHLARNWGSTRERIVTILARSELPRVAVLIFKDVIQRGIKSAVDTLAEESLRGPAFLGCSLGPAGKGNGAGTLTYDRPVVWES